MPTITPMLHVSDVRATALWYEQIGFSIVGWHEEDAEVIANTPLSERGEPLDWACVRLGADEVMFNAGGGQSDARRREVDLYVNVRAGSDELRVDTLYARLQGKVDVLEPPYNTFHGHRELVIRDLNGFWITFAEPVDSAAG